MSDTTQISQRGNAIKLQGEIATNVTKSDTTTYALGPVYVGTAGDVVLLNGDSSTALLKNVANGTFLPVIAKGIMSTGTTASDFVIFK